MKARAFLVLIVLVASSGCTTVAVHVVLPMIKDLSSVGYSKTDLDFMGKALPPSLLQLEGFHKVAPNDTELMVLIAEGKCGYAMGWVEDDDPQLASQYYLEGKELALEAIYKESKEYRKVIDRGGKTHEALKAITDEDVVPALFSLASCWGSWLNANKNETRAMFEVPSVLAANERILELEPGHSHGASYVFLAAYYTTLPAMAGGGLAKGHEYFEKAFEYGNNQMLLAHYFMAKTYAVKLKDLEDPASGKTGEQIFDEMLSHIETADPLANPDLGLINAIAKEKARKLAAERDQYF
jgi:hypothetical protein